MFVYYYFDRACEKRSVFTNCFHMLFSDYSGVAQCASIKIRFGLLVFSMNIHWNNNGSFLALTRKILFIEKMNYKKS